MKAKTADVARGKWRGILLALGVDAKFLNSKHGPCPMCGGTDRYRWDNSGGNGTFICNQCGSGNGFTLLKALRGWDFAAAATEVDAIVGNVSQEPVRQPMSDDRVRQLKVDLWEGARAIVPGDPAFAYLTGRVTLPKSLPACLRFHPAAPCPDGTTRPAMLAMVQDADGKGKQLHRTFLGPNGKADIPQPRAMMPGKVPEGGAVRLFPVHGERLGIAEGIETAFAAAAKFNVPVWSAINSTMLVKWTPPATVREVLIFGDCDAKFGGQASAFALAHKLAVIRDAPTVSVHIPQAIGHDWADSGVA